MTKKLKIAVISSVLVALAGGVTAFFIYLRNTSSLKVGLNDKLSFNYEVNKTLNPGESTSYDFLIEYNNHDKINFYLWFEHKKEVKDYSLYFKLLVNNEIIEEDKCNTYFELNKFNVPLDIKEDTKGKIVFYIPEYVGNEAQNISYDFVTKMNVEKR